MKTRSHKKIILVLSYALITFFAILGLIFNIATNDLNTKITKMKITYQKLVETNQELKLRIIRNTTYDLLEKKAIDELGFQPCEHINYIKIPGDQRLFYE